MATKDYIGSFDPSNDIKILERLEEQELKNQKEQDKLVTWTKSALINSSTPEQQDGLIDQVRAGLVNYVNSCMMSSEAGRLNIERDWIFSLRQYKGIYNYDVLARIHPNRCKAFVRTTRNKVRTVTSRLNELLFPAAGDKNWSIEPTPIPEFADERMLAMIEQVEQEEGRSISMDEFKVMLAEEGKAQSEKMSQMINDQLAELRYREVIREVINSGNIYGTGILKGPLITVTENQKYYKYIDESGNERWMLKDHDMILPFIENVRVWDLYPDMEATSFQDARYIIQRRKMNKHELISLARRTDFDGRAIRNYLTQYPDGVYRKREFEIHLQTMGDIISDTYMDNSKSKKYEVLEFWGYISTNDLRCMGVSIPAKFKDSIEIPANIWVLGDRVIKSVVSPIDGIRWPYYCYYYDKDETSPFGEGIPSVMRDIQELQNSAFRALIDNAAISAGPQIEVNYDLLSEDEDPRDVYPFKVWLRTGHGLDASNPAVRLTPLPSYTNEFKTLLDILSSYSDEVTTVPRYMWGESTPSVGRTASGMSMLMGSANVSIKDQVRNFDDGITKPFITAMYHWNMQFNTDETIKGDYNVVAQGSTSLIAKEMYMQALLQFLQLTSNPQDVSITRRTGIIRKVAEALDLNSNEFVLSDDEISMQQQQSAQKQQEERMFMNDVIEAARVEGISPQALIDNLNQVYQTSQQADQQQQQMQPQNPMMQQQMQQVQNVQA